MFWRRNGKIIKMEGKFVSCNECPCDCEPYVIAEKTTNGSDPARKTWDLTPYQGPYKAKVRKGARWRLIETGACLSYGSGTVNSKGEMVGLQDHFSSSYSYDGHMILEEGCYDEKTGKTTWTCCNSD